MKNNYTREVTLLSGFP